MKKYSTNNEVIAAFLNQEAYEGMNHQNSISFKGIKLYSYSPLLAKLDLPNKVLLIDSRIRNYSVTTSKQTGYLVNRARHLTIYSHPLDAKPDVVMNYYWMEIEQRISSYLKARIQQSKDAHKHWIQILLAEARLYAEYVNLDKRTKAWKYQNKLTQQMFKHKLL